MIIRRAITLASAVAVTTAALTLVASSASADELFCNTTEDGPLDGTRVCVVQDELIESTIVVPYHVGETCVATVCTPTADGQVEAPWDVDEDPIEANGTICVTHLKEQQFCQPFNTGDIY